MKLKIVIYLAAFVLLLSGCYDNNEIDSLANVTAVGIEEAGFTFAIADTGSFSGEGEKGTESSNICYFSKSDNIANAIEEINRKISKKLSFSHLSAIIVSENSAKKGFYETINYFEGMPDVRPQTLIAISDIEPSQYLENLKPSLEVNTEKYFLSLFQKDSSYIPVLKMSDYTNSLKCKKDVLAPLISKNTDENKVDAESTFLLKAVLIRNGRLCLELEDIATLGLLNSTKNVVLDYKNEKYIMSSSKKPKITAKLKNGMPYVNITFNLLDKTGDFDDEKFVEEKIKTYLKKISKHGYDIFGFSEKIKKCFLTRKAYDDYNWRGNIADCNYNVDVKITDGR